MLWRYGIGVASESKVLAEIDVGIAEVDEVVVTKSVLQNLLHGKAKIFIVINMTSALIYSAIFLALSGALIARLPLRAKLLPLLRRAR